MTPEDAVTYLKESQSIGSGVYGRICPRCGGPLEGRMVMNALSRRVPLYICSDCGVDEAMLDFRGQCPLPLEKWPLVREVMGSS
ncbi:hypothetical protein [Candidatus Methanoprimaticola sp. MG2]|uniref:hypothetical protein n=1 Tax=Candidatus Methanoprimaticola sp. MG2 TaxID=3228838 RepID=UPI0039C6CDC4